MTTPRQQYVRHAANWMVEQVNRDALTLADCSIDAIQQALEAPFFQNLCLSCQYYIDELTINQRWALAKSIAGAVANHPNRSR